MFNEKFSVEIEFSTEEYSAIKLVCEQMDCSLEEFIIVSIKNLVKEPLEEGYAYIVSGYERNAVTDDVDNMGVMLNIQRNLGYKLLSLVLSLAVLCGITSILCAVFSLNTEDAWKVLRFLSEFGG
jgi:hypothetical protein